MATVADPKCGNCGEAHDPDDIFCENCGYDFITGSMPRPDEGFIPAPVGGPVSENGLAGVVPQWRFEVGVDRAYYEEVVSQGELTFPEDETVVKVVELEAGEVHIGRSSGSRMIEADLDIAELTGDPAVSSRHAVLSVGSDANTVILTDLGSTNGTFVGTVDSEAVGIGVPITLVPGTRIFLGAWTYLIPSVSV